MNRNDGNDRKAFRKEFYDRIYSREATSLETFGNGLGGEHEWREGIRGTDAKMTYFGKPGFHSNEGKEPGWVNTQMDAGHVYSNESGRRLYAAEDRSQNRSDGAAIERSGAIMEKQAIEIDGASINRDTAQTWENRGVLKEGTVAGAQPIEGWEKGKGIVPGKEIYAVKNKPNQKMPDMSNEPKTGPSTGPAPSSMGGDSGKPPPDLSQASFPPREEAYKPNPQPTPSPDKGHEPSR
jgi:hypothetical protein